MREEYCAAAASRAAALGERSGGVDVVLAQLLLSVIGGPAERTALLAALRELQGEVLLDEAAKEPVEDVAELSGEGRTPRDLRPAVLGREVEVDL